MHRARDTDKNSEQNTGKKWTISSTQYLKHLCIWRADSNGQLGSRKRNEPELAKIIIGMNTTAIKTEHGNGKLLQKICITHEMIPINKWDPGQKQRDTLEASTWISPGGETHRQVDYILISQKYRNFTRKTHKVQSWRGDMEQKRQHAAINLAIRLHFKHNLFREEPPETGTDIHYNLKHARETTRTTRKTHARTQHMPAIQYRTHHNGELGT